MDTYQQNRYSVEFLEGEGYWVIKDDKPLKVFESSAQAQQFLDEQRAKLDEEKMAIKASPPPQGTPF